VRSIIRKSWFFFREALGTLTSGGHLQEMLRISLYANSIYLMLNSAATAVLGFVFWVVVARLYPTESVGLGSAIIAAAAMLSFVGTLGLGIGLIRFLPGAGAGAPMLINSCFTVSGLAAVAAGMIFLVGLPLWSPALSFIRGNPIFIAAFIAFVAAASIFALLDQVFIALRRAEFTLIKNLIQGMLKVTLVVGLAGLFKVFGIFASWGLAAAASLDLGILVFLPHLQPGYKPVPCLRRQVGNEMVHFSFANYVSTGLWSAPTWLLPIMVVNLLGGEANAYFYMSWAMAGLLFAIPLATSMSLFAEGSHEEDFLTRDVKRSFKLMAVLLLPAIVVMLIAGDKFLLLFGRQYSQEGAKVLWALAPSALPVSVNLLYLGIARVKKRLKDILLITTAIAMGTLALSYALLPHLGILGAGVGWLASHSLVALALLPKIGKFARNETFSGGRE